MFVKQRFYYRAHDYAQNSVLSRDGDEPLTCKEQYKFQAMMALCKECEMKMKESGEQRESTYTN